ncbi:MAG: transglutaminase-like domain-containing protein [Acidobacteriota bacterium]
MGSASLLAEFSAFAEQPDEALELAYGALLLGRFDHPELTVQPWLDRLDRLADAAPTAGDALERLTQLLYVDEGFRGNRLDYYDIRNSYLHEVLQRKLGIPITLAVVVLEVGRRLGLELDGVGFPGHFLVQVEAGQAYLDPFDRGRLLDRSDCVALFRQGVGKKRSRFEERFLAAVTSRQILVRMLNNMLGVSIREREPERVLFCLDSIVLLIPADPDARLQRGRYLFEAGDATRAIPDFESFLELSVDEPARRAVAAALDEARRRGQTVH